MGASPSRNQIAPGRHLSPRSKSAPRHDPCVAHQSIETDRKLASETFHEYITDEVKALKASLGDLQAKHRSLEEEVISLRALVRHISVHEERPHADPFHSHPTPLSLLQQPREETKSSTPSLIGNHAANDQALSAEAIVSKSLQHSLLHK